MAAEKLDKTHSGGGVFGVLSAEILAGRAGGAAALAYAVIVGPFGNFDISRILICIEYSYEVGEIAEFTQRKPYKRLCLPVLIKNKPARG